MDFAPLTSNKGIKQINALAKSEKHPVPSTLIPHVECKDSVETGCFLKENTTHYVMTVKQPFEDDYMIQNQYVP